MEALKSCFSLRIAQFRLPTFSYGVEVIVGGGVYSGTPLS